MHCDDVLCAFCDAMKEADRIRDAEAAVSDPKPAADEEGGSHVQSH